MKHKRKYPVWLSFPALLIYSVFFVVPIIYATVMSFSDWNMNRINEPAFYGLQNYIVLFTDPVFLRSIFNTFLYALATTIGKLVLGLALALILVKPVTGSKVFRTLFYMPCVLSTVVVGLLFTSVLSKDGLLNNILESVGLSPVNWLGQYPTAMLWIILMEIWMWSGFCMFIFISGLQAIPGDYYESASLDGATALQQFRHITLPLLVPSITVVMTLNISGGLKVFDMVYILTNGGPGFDTQVLNTYTYRAFGMGLLGQSCASAVILSIIVVAITFIINNTIRKKEVTM